MNWLRRRLVKVEITCPHGTFIPGAYRYGQAASRYSCGECPLTVKLSTHTGEVNW